MRGGWFGRICTVGALGLAVLVTGPVPGLTLDTAMAGEASPEDAARRAELDTLFARLANAADEKEAQTATDGIWAAWLRSGDPRIDKDMRLVVLAMNLQRFSAALTILDKMIMDAPGYAEAWNKRATVNFLVRKYDASLADIEKTLELEPRHFGALAGRAYIFTARGDKKAALAAIEQALKINPFLKDAQSVVERNGGVYRQQRGI